MTGGRPRYGEGELVEVSPGVWRFSINLGKDPLRPDKRARRKVRYHRGTRKSAIAARDKLKRELEAQRPGSESTLGQLADEWFKANRRRWQGQTEQNYRYAMRNLEPLMAIPLRQLEPRHVVALHAEWEANGLGYPSMHKAHRTLVTILNQGVRWRAIESNVASIALAVPEPKGLADQAPPDQAVDALLAAATPELRLFLELVAVTGARRTEVLALRWQDIDLPAKRLQINGALTGRSYATLTRGPTKTGKNRTVALDPATVAALTAAKAKADELAGGEASGYVFSSTPDGSVPTLANAWTSRVRQLREKLGLDKSDFWIHGLRHRAATRLVQAGVSLPNVAQQLGQVRLTTMRFYAHASEQGDEAIANILGSSFTRLNDAFDS